jgi:hypothetical protein
MERGQSRRPELQWLWSSFGAGAPGLAGAPRHNLFTQSQAFAPKRERSALRSAPARTVSTKSAPLQSVDSSCATRRRASLAPSDQADAVIHLRAFAILEAHGNASMLSRQFGELLASAGRRASGTHQSTGKTRTSRRNRATGYCRRCNRRSC